MTLSHLTDSTKTVSPVAEAMKAARRILIVTDNPTICREVIGDIRGHNFDVQMALFDGHKLASTPKQAPAAILCVLSDYIHKAEPIIGVLRHHYAPRDIPIIGALSRDHEGVEDIFDTVMFAPVHSTQVANRVNSMIRLGQMQAEIIRRLDTLRESFGQEIALDETKLNRPFRILFVGKADPAFMVVINALQEKNVEVVAAFTSFSAFDYLHDSTFDAVVMNGMTGSEPAITITETMRRNARLYHVPTLFLVPSTGFEDVDKAYAVGVSDLIPADSELEEVSGRILELANYRRIHEQLKAEFGKLGRPQCIDAASDTFNETFFVAHLDRVVRDMRTRSMPVTLVAMRLKPKQAEAMLDTDALMRAYGQVGEVMKSMVRMQDLVARWSEDSYILAFPETDEAMAQIIVERMSGLIDCAAYDAGPNVSGSLTFAMDIAVAELSEHETSDLLISHVWNDLNASRQIVDVA